MAHQALRDQKEREVEVNREELLKILIENREKHIKEYNEAVLGYKAMALSSLEKAYTKAKVNLDKNYREGKELLEKFDPANPNASDYLRLVDSQGVELKVPKNCSKEYDVAIDIAKYDVNQTLKLSYAEFQCFIRDEWDWSGSVKSLNAMYTRLN